MVLKNLDLKNVFFFISAGSIVLFTLLFAGGFAIVSLIRKYGENLPKIALVTGNKRVPEEEIEDKRVFLRLQFRRNYKFVETWFGKQKIILFKYSAIKGVLQLEQNSLVQRLVPATFYVSNKCNKIHGIRPLRTTSRSQENLPTTSLISDHPNQLWTAFLKCASLGKQWGSFTHSDIDTEYIKSVSSWSCSFADRALLGMYNSQLEQDTLICIDTGKMLRETVLFSALAPIIDPSEPEFKPLAQAFTKLTDVSHWALGTLGYANIMVMKMFLKWLMSSEINIVRSAVDRIMSNAPPDSAEYKLYKKDKRLLQDEVIYSVITFNTETASHLITSFYDIATHPALRKQLRQEQRNISLDLSKITSDDPLTHMKTFRLEDLEDSEAADAVAEDESSSNITQSLYNDSGFVSDLPQSIRRVPSTPSLVSYTNELSQGGPDSSLDSQSTDHNETSSVNNFSTISSKFTAGSETTNDFSSSSHQRSQTDASSNVDGAGNLKESIPSDVKINIKNQQGFNQDGFDDYPLNISGSGRRMLEKCQIYYNHTADVNLLTLKMARSFSLLNACILESYRVCPPTCSQLWVVKKDVSSGFTKHSALLLSETNTLNKGDFLSFCSSAVYELQDSPNSSDSKPEPETTKEEYSYASTSATNDSEAEQITNTISSYDSFMPVENWDSNFKFQYELHGVLGRNRSHNYDFIRVLLSHLLIRTDFSTFEWGKPKTKDSFLLYTSLYNSSLMFRLQRKFN